MESPRDILRRHGLSPKKSWGQNFLGDESTLDDIVEALELRADETVVELGPGLGHLTRALLKTGARVVAIERDRDMVAVLKAELPEVTLVEGNAAEIDFAKAAGTRPIALIGNLPYHLSSSILFAALEQRESLSRAVFTLQKEVVERIAAPPGGRDYGLLSVLLGLWFDLEELFVISAQAFHPPPKVDSAVLRLRRRPTPRAEVIDPARFIRIVRAGFGHRRKTLSNALRVEAELGSAEQITAALERAGIDPMRRAETLSPEEFAALERGFQR